MLFVNTFYIYSRKEDLGLIHIPLRKVSYYRQI